MQAKKISACYYTILFSLVNKKITFGGSNWPQILKIIIYCYTR